MFEAEHVPAAGAQHSRVTLAHLQAFRRGPAQYRMYISYLEIYQDRLASHSHCWTSLTLHLESGYGAWQDSGYDLLRDDSAHALKPEPTTLGVFQARARLGVVRSGASKICLRSCCERPIPLNGPDMAAAIFVQDEDGNMHLRNLSVNLAASEEVDK